MDKKACGIIMAIDNLKLFIRCCPLKINGIDVYATLKKGETVLSEEKGLSPAVRSMVELLVLLITLLVRRSKLNSSNSSKPPSSDSNREYAR